jgi:hypothetical protein
MVKLYCVVVGVTGSAFPLYIDASLSVGDLKEAIKMKNPSTMKCDAYKLQLYLAKKGNAWITNNEAEGVSDVAGLPHLRVPQAKLRCVGLSDDEMVEVDEHDEAAGNGLVNVLVVVPTEEIKPEFQTYNALVEKIDNLQDIIQTRLPTSNSSLSFSSRALGQMVMKRIAKNFSKHSPTEGNPILTKVEQMEIQPNILEKELVVEMTKHFNRILPQTGYPLVFVNSEDFGWLEQHPDVSRKTDMKPDGFVTFQGLFCHREKQECPAGCNFGIPFVKLLDSIVIVKAKRVIDDGALGEVSTPLIRH